MRGRTLTDGNPINKYHFFTVDIPAHKLCHLPRLQVLEIDLWQLIKNITTLQNAHKEQFVQNIKRFQYTIYINDEKQTKYEGLLVQQDVLLSITFPYARNISQCFVLYHLSIPNIALATNGHFFATPAQTLHSHMHLQMTPQSHPHLESDDDAKNANEEDDDGNDKEEEDDEEEDEDDDDDDDDDDDEEDDGNDKEEDDDDEDDDDEGNDEDNNEDNDDEDNDDSENEEDNDDASQLDTISETNSCTYIDKLMGYSYQNGKRVKSKCSLTPT